MSSAEAPRSRVQERTRRTILDAAVRALTADAGASLAAIAAEAGVGRTTLHRYYPDRAGLLKAIADDALERAAAAAGRARLDEGPALEALERLCQECFELGEVLMLLYSEPKLLSAPEWDDMSDGDREVLDVIARGQREGTIDPAAPPEWLYAVVWALMYSAWEHVRSADASRHEALSLCLRTLRRAIAP